MSPDDIRAWRKTHGDISQRQLGELLGVPTMTVSQWEQGRRGGPPGNLLMLSLAALDRMIVPARTGPVEIE